MNTYYLNNSGSKWIVFDKDGRREQITLTTKSCKEVLRRVIYWEQFGNFATACISYKGKRISVFTDTLLDD
jgi:hypothetical protein